MWNISCITSQTASRKCKPICWWSCHPIVCTSSILCFPHQLPKTTQQRKLIPGYSRSQKCQWLDFEMLIQHVCKTFVTDNVVRLFSKTWSQGCFSSNIGQFVEPPTGASQYLHNQLPQRITLVLTFLLVCWRRCCHWIPWISFDNLWLEEVPYWFKASFFAQNFVTTRDEKDHFMWGGDEI